MILLVDYSLKIRKAFDISSNVGDGIKILIFGDLDKKLIHKPEGFYFDTSLTECSDDYFNDFIKTNEYKQFMRKLKLENIEEHDVAIVGDRIGTIVHIYDEKNYEVEFPGNSVETISKDKISLIVNPNITTVKI